MSTPDVIAFETTVSSGDLAYVHARAGDDRLPLVVVIHGSHVHPRHYSRYADLLAAQGFVVIAPEHVREFMGSTAHYPQQAMVNWGLDWAEAANADPESPLFGRIDTSTLFVSGHSMGGGTTLGIVSDFDQLGLVVDPWSRPGALKGAIANGTHNIPPPRTGDPLPVDNQVPVAFFHGSVDHVVTLDQAERSFQAVHGVKPRLWLQFEGSTHFFLTDEDAPEGAHADKFGPALLDQDTSIAGAARWAGLWFKACAGDAEAQAQIRKGPGADEPHLSSVYVED